ncbi:MAG TPA: F0F1 ATP synthase subunit B [Solirubrobacterales bacterium]|nr:F0F1 ATP synthase subunit B [Solirubrobacterales bacterium]
MELLGDIAAIVPLATEAAGGEEGGGSFLVSPGLGLMIWTLILFGITMWVLSKLAFPKIQEALDKRAKTIAESLDAAERQRRESDELLAEYRGRLAEAREQADDIMARARKAAETAEAEATTAGREKREELVAQAKRDIEAETRRSLEQIRGEVADLTVLATEKVTRKSLSGEDQKRLVEEALAEVDFSSLSGAEKN